MDLTAYHKSIEYLESFIRGPAEAPAAPSALEESRKRRVPATRALLGMFGSPQEQFKAVHIGGTSGKGSTCAMVATVLMESGYRVGLHTSPYLQTPLEKAVVNGRYMAPGEMVGLIESSKPVISRFNASEWGPVNYTQLWLAITLSYFARQKVDLAVVEVGVGGRYDFTNVLEPLATAITSVSMDHAETLGPGIRDIAWNKAGIAKKGVSMVTGVDSGEALPVIEEECRNVGAPLYRLGREIRYEKTDVTPSGASFSWQQDSPDSRSRIDDLRVSLLGEHQIANASVALGVLHSLRNRGFDIPETAIRSGLLKSGIPGRLEVLAERPTVVLDGAHNPAKARVLKEALQRLFTYRKLVLVLGVITSKEAEGIIRELVPLASAVITTATTVTGKPFTPPERLAKMAEGPDRDVLWEDDPMLAVDKALELAEEDDLVCITGSIYLIGRVRERWVPLTKVLQSLSS